MATALTQDETKMICEMYKNGDAPGEIARCFGVHPNSVYNVLAREKVPTRTVSRTRNLGPLLDEMKALYAEGLSLAAVGKRVGLGATAVHKHLTRAGVQLRARWQSGDSHPQWLGGRIVNSHGYVMVRVNKEYVLEHHLVMEKKLGRPLTDSETVHHKDTDRQNNHPDNLELRQGRHGKGGVFRCVDCGSHNIVATKLAEKN